MAKKSSIEKNNRRRRMAKKFANRRASTEGDRARQEAADGGAVRRDPQARRIAAQFFGDAHPQSLRTVAAVRAPITASIKLSRIALRDLGSKGLIPGLVKSSW